MAAFSRADLGSLAKLCEQAQRYDDMAGHMRAVSISSCAACRHVSRPVPVPVRCPGTLARPPARSAARPTCPRHRDTAVLRCLGRSRRATAPSPHRDDDRLYEKEWGQKHHPSSVLFDVRGSWTRCARGGGTGVCTLTHACCWPSVVCWVPQVAEGSNGDLTNEVRGPGLCDCLAEACPRRPAECFPVPSRSWRMFPHVGPGLGPAGTHRRPDAL